MMRRAFDRGAVSNPLIKRILELKTITKDALIELSKVHLGDQKFKIQPALERIDEEGGLDVEMVGIAPPKPVKVESSQRRDALVFILTKYLSSYFSSARENVKKRSKMEGSW